MPKIETSIPIIPLSSIATMLNAKVRNLKAYEEKGLLPHHDSENKLYSIDDVKWVQFVHYLAANKRINASGIRYILKLLETTLSEEQVRVFLLEADQALKDTKDDPQLDIPDTF